MGIIRVKKDKGFFAVSNTPFNDKELSWEARGIMGYLLSKPDEWQIRFYDLVNQGPAGEHKIRRVLKELEKQGYMDRQRTQTDEGKFDWVTTLYETPTIPRLPIYGLSTDGLPTGGVPINGKPRDIVSTDPISTDAINTKEEVLKLGGGGFYIFNLVGYDYSDADSGTKKAIAALFKKHGEYRICQLAADVVLDYPDASLQGLLAHLKRSAELLPIKPLSEAEGDYY